MSLALRVVLLTLLAAVPVFLIQVVREVRLREDRAAEIVDSARTYAGLTAARTDRFIEGARVLLVAASRLDSVRRGLSVECAQELARVQVTLPEFPTVAAFHPTGTAPCSSNPNPTGTNISDRAYFRETLATKQFVVSDYVVGRVTGSGTIAFTYPGLDQAGNVAAVMLMFINSGPLSQLLQEVALPPGAFVALLDRTGTIVAHAPEPTAFVGRPAAETLWGRDLPVSDAGATRATAPDGAEFAVGYAALDASSRMSLVVGLPLGPALQSAETLFFEAMLLTVA